MNSNIEVKSEWGEDGILHLKSWAGLIFDSLAFSIVMGNGLPRQTQLVTILAILIMYVDTYGLYLNVA